MPAEPAKILARADELAASDDDPVDAVDVILPATDLGNARRLVHHHGGTIRHAPQLGMWLEWDGHRWAEDITGGIHRRAKAVVDNLLAVARTLGPERRRELVKHWTRSQSASRLRAMVDLAATEPGIPVTVDQLDADPWALNVANGTIDLRTGDLRPHDPVELHTKLAPVHYDPAAPAPQWNRFLDDVFGGDQDLVGFVRRFAGYSLTADVSEQLLVFCHGAGSNGKSVLLGALHDVVGGYGLQLDVRVLTMADHDQHPTGLTDLRGARLVTTVESEQGRYLAESLVKAITGGDPIRARRMRADYFEFKPSHKLWMAGNHLPRVRGTDTGIWRRIALLPFDETFTGARADTTLPAKLTAERAGILAWAVAGCLEWQRDGLQVPDRVRKATADYRASEDHVGRFLADTTTTSPTAYVSARDLRTAYEQWCAGEGERAWTAKALGAELTARGFDSARVGKANVRAWIGLGLTTDRSDDATL